MRRGRGGFRWVRVALLAAALALPAAAVEPPSGRIAYLAMTEGRWQVWVMAPDGSGARQLTRSAWEKTRASWAPCKASWSASVGSVLTAWFRRASCGRRSSQWRQE